ncbi:glycosyltransferase 87 family protein [Amorphoplanes nipponensis]|uniref:Membrane protein n=1 Tax=Actinoplanes nipponensis TaxID=135950 RepID=A0A919JKX9_9ACTN|nr:glycosyltransferase 87 family protein [Actinoplanes nipponensis]GIE51135.1 membrane protein [Actinoplanes nipponensis]
MTRRAWTIAAVAALVSAVVLWWSADLHFFFDSRVYTGAVRYWFRDDGMVYDWLEDGTPYGFTYPPFAGLLMAPMAFLPFPLVLIVAGAATIASTALVTWWLAGPLIRRSPWPPRLAGALAVALALCFEPVRETFGFGQVNTLLLTLVVGDVLFGVARGRRWGGIGIGLATAVKLTPGVFILYLLVTGRWRAAGTAIAAAAAATLVAAGLFPDESREFWTAALWDTNRVGNLEYLSNQSLRGLLARLPLDAVEAKVWLVCVLATLGFWVWRVRAAARRGDDLGGLALTGLLGCLISPVTWVHHCVWLLPAIVRCVDAGLSGRDRRALWLGGSAYVVLTSRLTWAWEHGPRPPLAPIGSNLYVWFSLALLAGMPLAARPDRGAPPEPAPGQPVAPSPVASTAVAIVTPPPER